MIFPDSLKKKKKATQKNPENPGSVTARPRCENVEICFWNEFAEHWRTRCLEHGPKLYDRLSSNLGGIISEGQTFHCRGLH